MTRRGRARAVSAPDHRRAEVALPRARPVRSTSRSRHAAIRRHRTGPATRDWPRRGRRRRRPRRRPALVRQGRRGTPWSPTNAVPRRHPCRRSLGRCDRSRPEVVRPNRENSTRVVARRVVPSWSCQPPSCRPGTAGWSLIPRRRGHGRPILHDGVAPGGRRDVVSTAVALLRRTF